MWRWTVGALVALLLVPASASATVLTYYPDPGTGANNNLGNLDHTTSQNFYAWTIQGIPVITAGQQISSAYLTFKSLYNWDANANMLYLDLFDHPAPVGTVMSSSSGNASGTTNPYTSTVDQTADGSSLGTFTDDSKSVLSGNSTFLTEHAFLPQGVSPAVAGNITSLDNVLTAAGLNPVDAQFGTANPQWTFAPDGSGWDYTYNFTQSQLTALTAYINAVPTGNITLAFDPDCHFFNNGISLTMVTGSISTSGAVPEPASLILLGTGLLLTASRYRRRRKIGTLAQK
jgi:hypothetical protein